MSRISSSSLNAAVIRGGPGADPGSTHENTALSVQLAKTLLSGISCCVGISCFGVDESLMPSLSRHCCLCRAEEHTHTQSSTSSPSSAVAIVVIIIIIIIIIITTCVQSRPRPRWAMHASADQCWGPTNAQSHPTPVSSRNEHDHDDYDDYDDDNEEKCHIANSHADDDGDKRPAQLHPGQRLDIFEKRKQHENTYLFSHDDDISVPSTSATDNFPTRSPCY